MRMKCPTCNHVTFFYDENGCCPFCTPEQRISAKRKNAKKMGRPVTKTSKGKRLPPAAPHREHSKRKTNPAVNIAQGRAFPQAWGYVVEFEGAYKGNPGQGFGPFEKAKRYQKIGHARLAVKVIGKGVVMECFETEGKTRQVYAALVANAAAEHPTV